MRYVLFLAALPLFAQLPAPNAAGVSAGHEHLRVKDVEAHNRFWIGLGGVPVELGRIKMIKIPGVYIMAIGMDNSGGSEGTTVDSIGLKVKNMKESLAKWDAAGIHPLVSMSGINTWVELVAPGGVKLHIIEDPSLATPIASDTLQMNVTNAKEAQAWYEKYFGNDIPGSRIIFGEVKTPAIPTKGRGLDHIGFEVKNLEALCKRMEADGIKFDRPYSRPAGIPLGVAIFTDPWGTYVELNEGFAAAP